MYSNRANENKSNLSKSEILCKNFTQLVMQNYNKTRNVAWYAEKLGITQTHLCTTVKQATEIPAWKLFRAWLSWMQSRN